VADELNAAYGRDDILAIDVNVNQTIWACPTQAAAYESAFPSISHVDGVKHTTMRCTKVARLAGCAPASSKNKAPLVTVVNVKIEDTDQVLLAAPMIFHPATTLGMFPMGGSRAQKAYLVNYVELIVSHFEVFARCPLEQCKIFWASNGCIQT
jgi:hypothetical protein